jgi:lysophospholipase L1-like esterase
MESRVLSLRKKIFFYVIIVATAVVGVELALRIAFALRVGPSVVLYGTPWVQPRYQQKLDPKGTQARHFDKVQTVSYHDNVLTSYSKYFPNQARVDFDEKGEIFKVVINAHGFRGKEWRVEKGPGVFRVVTLGASSTFGFHDREDETYPHYLEQYLNDWIHQNPRPGISSVEVINLAIPHLLSSEIRALYMAEGARLSPDVVTFYEGINDASRSSESAAEERKLAIKSIPLVTTLYRQLRARSIMVALFGHLISPIVESYTAQAAEDHMHGRSERFIGNINEIQEMCRTRNAVFVVMNQMTQSETFPRDRMRGFTYEDEVDYVRNALSTRGQITTKEMWFYSHSRLMADLERWARTNQVPFVDIIDALDQRRDCLISWVHLTPEGNRLVAAALAAEIRKHIGEPESRPSRSSGPDATGRPH